MIEQYANHDKPGFYTKDGDYLGQLPYDQRPTGAVTVGAFFGKAFRWLTQEEFDRRKAALAQDYGFDAHAYAVAFPGFDPETASDDEKFAVGMVQHCGDSGRERVAQAREANEREERRLRDIEARLSGIEAILSGKPTEAERAHDREIADMLKDDPA